MGFVLVRRDWQQWQEEVMCEILAFIQMNAATFNAGRCMSVC